MYDHLENLTEAQAYVARTGAKDTGGVNTASNLVVSFIDTLSESATYITNSIIKDIGARDFVKTACQIEASEGTLDFFFEGFMNEGDRIDFFQKHIGYIEDFLSDEADLDDVNMIERVERVRAFFPQEVGSDRPIPNDIDFSQGELYEVFLDDDTDHKHYRLVASSITCEVLEVIADKFTSFLNEALKTANTADLEANNTAKLDNFKEGYDSGYTDGYEQAKKDVMAVLNAK